MSIPNLQINLNQIKIHLNQLRIKGKIKEEHYDEICELAVEFYTMGLEVGNELHTKEQFEEFIYGLENS